MGVEGVVDSAQGEHLHTDGHNHMVEGADQASIDTDDEEHCSHSCHSHTVSLGTSALTFYSDISDEQVGFYQPHFLNFSQAPPTPPPTA